MLVFDCTRFMSARPVRRIRAIFIMVIFSELRRSLAADELPCHNSTRCPLLSQPAVTVFTYLFQQSPNLSLHHSSVSFSPHHFFSIRLQTTNHSFTNNPPLSFCLHSSVLSRLPSAQSFPFSLPYTISHSYQFPPLLSSATQYLTHLCNSG